MNDTQRNNWSIWIKVLIAVASALLGALGGVQAKNIISML